jgi:aryl-alcohol dehydrogenase-like predicted oxidoreductase
MARHGEAGVEAETFRALRALSEIARSLGEPLAKVAIAWLLHQAGVTSVIVGARNAAQAEDNARAAGFTLDSSALSALDRATQPLKQCLGDNADLWQGGEHSRYR